MTAKAKSKPSISLIITPTFASENYYTQNIISKAFPFFSFRFLLLWKNLFWACVRATIFLFLRLNSNFLIRNEKNVGINGRETLRISRSHLYTHIILISSPEAEKALKLIIDNTKRETQAEWVMSVAVKVFHRVFLIIYWPHPVLLNVPFDEAELAS